MKEKLSLRLITDREEFRTIAKEWNALLGISSSRTIFLTHEWLESWWSVLGQKGRLRLLVFYSNENQLVGGVAFYIRRWWLKGIFPVRELRFIGTGSIVCPDHVTALSAPGCEEKIAAATRNFLVSTQKEWDLIDLTNTDTEDLFCKFLLQGITGTGRWVRTTPEDDTSPFLSLEGQTWEEVMASLSGGMRNNIRRRRKNLAAEFNTKFVKVTDPSQIKKGMQDFMRLHGRRKLSIRMKDKFRIKAYRQFHELFFQECAARGWLHLSFLELDGKRVAGVYGFEYDSRLSIYQTGFDPNHARLGVAQVLLGHVVEDGCNRSLKEIDFLRGRESYKYDWTSCERKVSRHWVGGKTFVGKTLFLLLKVKQKVGSSMELLRRRPIEMMQRMGRKGLGLLRKTCQCLIYKDVLKVFVYDVKETPVLTRILVGKLDCRWIDPGDEDAKTQLVLLKEERSAEKFERRWREGHRCYGAFTAGRLVHIAWLSPKSWCIWKDSRKRPVGKGNVFFYDALTHPDYRAKGIAVRALQECCNELTKEGIRHLYCTIELRNRPSLKTYTRVGFRETGAEVMTLRFFGKTIYEKLTTKGVSHGGIRILTTYAIPQSERWREKTHLMRPRREEPSGILGRWGFRDWTLAFRLFRERKKYDLFVTGCDREDGLFAILQSLLPGKRIPHLMTCCLWKYETDPVRKWWKGLLLRWVARSVTLFLVWSKQECEAYSAYFKIPREKFVFMPHHVSLDGYQVEEKKGDYIFAGGDSSRDYDTLLEAVRPLSIPTVIVAKQVARWNGKPLPPHVTAKTTDPLEFRRLMGGARLVVLPLSGGLLQSTGQQSYLNAMTLKKPVIVSEVPGVLDHITPEVTGIVVPPGDPVALREAILRVIAGGPEVQKMVEAAYQRVQNEFSLDHFVGRILSLGERVSQNGK